MKNTDVPIMPHIFISYRRADSEAITGRIYDRLVAAFGKNNVFQDVENIPVGVNFKIFLQDSVKSCDILLVIIGQKWVTILDDEKRRRLDNPEDFVRLEVEAGLERSEMLVVPVLVDNAPMPDSDDLPNTLRELCLRNAARVRQNPDFNSDVDHLIGQLKATSIRPSSTEMRVTTQRHSIWISRAIIIALLSVAIFLVVFTMNRFSIADLGMNLTTTQSATSTPFGSLTGQAMMDVPFANVYENMDRTKIIGVIKQDSLVTFFPDTLNDNGSIRIEQGELLGWVNTGVVEFKTCPYIADGYDSPVGTEEERRSNQVWPGEWIDASPFAKLYFIGTSAESYSEGADLNLPKDEDAHAPVYAVASGTVKYADRLEQGGNAIVIEHDPVGNCDGLVLYSRYTGVERILVNVGDRVERGQQITTVGNAFGIFAYHLHFSISRSIGVALYPDYWPGKDLTSLLENFLDPRTFIQNNRPQL